MHRPHVIFKLGHDRIRVSTMPKTATQTPISVSSASVDKVCDWTGPPAVERCRATSGIGAAATAKTKCTLNSVGIKKVDMPAGHTRGSDKVARVGGREILEMRSDSGGSIVHWTLSFLCEE